MTTVLSGLLIGTTAFCAGVAVFRWRTALIRYGYGLRRQVVGEFLANRIRAADKVVLPLIAAVLCALGLLYIGYTVTQVIAGRAP